MSKKARGWPQQPHNNFTVKTMRKRISRHADSWGEEVIVDDPEDRHKSRNVNANVVGYEHDSEVDYEDVGHETIIKGTTLKIETSPAGQELYKKTVKIGDVVYWGIKRAKQ